MTLLAFWIAQQHMPQLVVMLFPLPLPLSSLPSSLPPSSPSCSVPIKITLSALNEREYNFNLQCKVRRKPSPVTLNVKAEVYAISVVLEYEQSDGTVVRMPEGKAALRKMDMGTVGCLTQCLVQHGHCVSVVVQRAVCCGHHCPSFLRLP